MATDTAPLRAAAPSAALPPSRRRPRPLPSLLAVLGFFAGGLLATWVILPLLF